VFLSRSGASRRRCPSGSAVLRRDKGERRFVPRDWLLRVIAAGLLSRGRVISGKWAMAVCVRAMEAQRGTTRRAIARGSEEQGENQLSPGRGRRRDTGIREEPRELARPRRRRSIEDAKHCLHQRKPQVPLRQRERERENRAEEKKTELEEGKEGSRRSVASGGERRARARARVRSGRN